MLHLPLIYSYVSFSKIRSDLLWYLYKCKDSELLECCTFLSFIVMSALVRLGVIYNGIYISVRIASYLNAAPSSHFSVKEEHIW